MGSTESGEEAGTSNTVRARKVETTLATRTVKGMQQAYDPKKLKTAATELERAVSVLRDGAASFPVPGVPDTEEEIRYMEGQAMWRLDSAIRTAILPNMPDAEGLFQRMLALEKSTAAAVRDAVDVLKKTARDVENAAVAAEKTDTRHANGKKQP